MKSKYMAVIPFLFAFGVLLISGCSVTTQKSTSSQENMLEIIIGSDDFPPFNYSDENGEPAGIDVDIANEALGRLGYKPVFTKIVWDDKDKDLENKDFDINRLLHEIREVIEKQVYERGISLSEKEYNLKYRYLNGSPVHLKRILMNIISNAVKYNKEKGEILLSYYETQVDNRHILFEFQCKDTGVGMSKEFQNHIFEPFTQETGGARSVYGGTGLGMPITKKLIEKMGGTIKFE